MKISQSRKPTITGTLDDGADFEFDFEPVDGDGVLIHQEADKMIVGYLSYDSYPQNPLEDSDGNGHIHSTHKNASKNQHEAYLKAIGCDRYGNLDDDITPNPYAIILDCYQHSMTVWAVSGSPEAKSFPDQRWDVAHGVGVWVADEAAKEECDRRANVYALFDLNENSKGVWQIKPKVSGLELPENIDGLKFVSKWDAFAYAGDIAASPAILSENIAAGRNIASRELAAEACTLYNQFLNNEVFGIVVATYTNENPDADPEDAEWVLEDSNKCWGYFGKKETEIMLAEEFKTACEICGKLKVCQCDG